MTAYQSAQYFASTITSVTQYKDLMKEAIKKAGSNAKINYESLK